MSDAEIRDKISDLGQKGKKTLYPKKPKIGVSMASCGLAAGADAIFNIIQKEVKKLNLDWIIRKTGCPGYCQKEPLFYFQEPGKQKLYFGELTEAKTKKIIKALSEGQVNPKDVSWKVAEDKTIDETILFSSKKEELEEVQLIEEYGFFKKQEKIALRNCGFLDPKSIEEYIARGGYSALKKVLDEMKPAEVIKTIKDSGLRGRGGAGFPTGLKWELCAKEQSDIKYIICNADEGDPGAYMDRSILEGDPHSIIEGMLIGAYAIGASEGFIYVRAEYPLAIEMLELAIEQARKNGFLGKNILGSKLDFDISLVHGAGAFVCGEETALIASIEGRPIEPRIRPPFPAQSGLWGKPTNINNVETWANVPPIILKGSKWFFSMGTENSKGTKVFSLVGKINNTGLVEVPMGITLREIIFDIGGGIINNKKFKAVQTGGPSGGCIPESMIDLPVDYESLTQAGSIMGSGGMIVVDEDTCMVDLAKFFINFTREESCGKCVSCRDGLDASYYILEKITEGKATVQDLEYLEELAQSIIDFSMCGLGTTAPNPVLTTLKYFKDEYLAHIERKECPAKVCKALIMYEIVGEKCVGCQACAKLCPEKAITGEKDKVHYINQSLCVKCGVCYDTCRYDSIIKRSGNVK
ncbi:MAG: NADH-quinone oxidoreductase subunit NuoF [Candidatus Heimdallarchaeaceae archaeon]